MKSKTVKRRMIDDDDDDGVGAGKAAVDRRDGPDENAQSLHDDNHGVPVLDCLTMTAGRGALPEPRPRPGDVGLLGKSRRAASDPLMSLGEVAGRLWEERGMSA